MNTESHAEHKKIKKLYRSENNKVIAGICGGLGEYFEADATIIRLFWLLIVVFTGIFPGVVAYILALFLVPKHPGHNVENKTASTE